MGLLRPTLLSLPLFLLFAGVTAQSVQVKLTPLNNYFLSNSVKLKEGINTMVISHTKSFDSHFGMAKTATNTIVRPDFKQVIVVAVAWSATSANTTLSLLRAERSGTFLDVYFSVNQGGQLSYTVKPLAMGMVGRIQGVRTVRFYNGSIMIRTVHIKL